MKPFIPAELERFSWFTQERYLIKLKKDAGLPPPWTVDYLLGKYHFNNVFRRDDKTSLLINEFIYARTWSGDASMVEAAVFCRLINKASTIEPAWYARQHGLEALEDSLRRRGINTQAYRINTPEGLNSLAGVARLAYARRAALAEALGKARSLKDAHGIMNATPYLGGFMGYQILLDLLEAQFWDTEFDSAWALAGPGACRGVLHLQGHKLNYDWTSRRDFRKDAGPLLRAMPELLNELTAFLMERWPWLDNPLTVHETEFMLCEWDKYVRKLAAPRPSGRLYPPRSLP